MAKVPKKVAKKINSQKKAKASAKAPNGQDQAAENPRAVAGSNSALTEDQQRALFYNHRKIYEKELAAKKAQDAKFKAACKMIKAEGTKLEDIKTAIKLGTPEGELEVKNEIEARLKIARWENSAIGHQYTLLPEPPAVDLAYEEGKVAGLRALPRAAPYDPSVPQYHRWLEGYADGQAVLAMKFKPPPKPKTEKAEKTPAPPAPPASAESTGEARGTS